MVNAATPGLTAAAWHNRLRFARKTNHMAHVSEARRRQGHSLLMAPFLVFLGVVAIAASYIGYVLWPRWPGVPVTLESPALPIVVGGAMFNIEPAAIRRPLQRKPGTQD